MSRAARTFDALVARRLRARRQAAVDRMPAVAARLYRAADRAAAMPWANERSDLPPAIDVGGRTVDVVEDLVAFTGLDRADVETELRTRRRLNFRGEWHATPPGLRNDDWFYLSSKTYLFANAVHFADATVPDRVCAHVDEGGLVLDFGGGAGQLTLALTARGRRVAFVDINALQRDFLRFRVARHGLGDLIEVRDPWDALPPGAFAGIVAIDVLEHLPDVRRTVRDELVPSLAPGGVLVEDSPFVVNASNPMHHEDPGLDEELTANGMELVERDGPLRVWRAAG